MRKLLFVALAIILALSKCASVHIAHDNAARRLLHKLSKLSLPEGARVIDEHSDVGGFISGTGDAIDVIAFRVFASDRSETDVNQFFSDFVHDDMGDRGVFKLDKPEPPNSKVPEYFLRRMIPPQKASSYVVYMVWGV